MSGSGLIVLLPLVGAGVGALIGAVATGVVTAWREMKARDREREGLLRVIDAKLYEPAA